MPLALRHRAVSSANSGDMIRESKAHQLDNVISSSAADGMISMDQSLLQLAKAGRIGQDAALGHCINSEWLRKRLALNS